MAGYSVLSFRYAQSFLSLTEEKGLTNLVQKDMLVLRALYNSEEELRSFLKNPVININTKKAVIKKAFVGKVSEATLLFIEKLCEARREMFIGEIAESFIDSYKTMKGVITAKVTSAIPINEKIRTEVTKIIKNNKEFIDASSIEIEEKIDAGIIGGLIITVADKQVDASFSRKINEYRMAFSKNLYVKEF